MKVVVFGANGATGREILKSALGAGYEVIAAVRRPETVQDVSGLSRVATISFDDPKSVSNALTGCDAVIVAIGHGGLKASAQPTTLYSDSIRTIRGAMREQGVRRITVLSSGGTVQDPAAPWFYTKLIRRYLINTYLDMARMETILEESDLEWTAIRLTFLKKGKSMKVIAREGRLGGGRFEIHYQDAAAFIVKDLKNKSWINKHPVLGY
mmetsp:Transcript_39235/g.95964  ORF Transcript_39235/g.95964 Transcript_39235/m.95964 type:complete len:210 (+) Transcript_39235:41-670(+)